jgi:hypothetical protein
MTYAGSRSWVLGFSFVGVIAKCGVLSPRETSCVRPSGPRGQTVNDNVQKVDDEKTVRDTTNTNGNRQKETQFDWIKQRSECSLPKVFATLRSQIEQDVNTRNSLRPKTAPYEFSVRENLNEITVRLQADGPQGELHKSVIFNLHGHAISVRDDVGNRLFEVTVTFDDTGKCRLNVNGEERDFWQVRRMALEDLMFHGL